MSGTTDLIADSVNRMFSERVDRALLADAEAGGWPAGLWSLIEDGGYPLLLAGDAGDGESAWANAYPVFHALGFHRVPLPLAETIVANALLARAGLATHDGPMTVIQQDGGLNLALQGGHLVINGTASSIPWAHAARQLVVCGEAGGERVIGVASTESAGISVTPAVNIAGEPRDRVTFEHVRCDAFTSAGALPQAPVTLFCALARAVQMVGAGESVLRQSIGYAQERVQFGHAIAHYQAIQQALAVLAGEVACARMAALVACETAGAVPGTFAVAAAKIRCGRMAAVATNIAHEVHGAFGFTHEHTLHYATRRLWAWRAEYGAESVWAARLGRQAIELGGEAFWPSLTARAATPSTTA